MDKKIHTCKTADFKHIPTRLDLEPHVLQTMVLTALQAGITHFLFEKANGEQREAYGTLNASFMPSRKAILTDRMYDILEAIADRSKEPVDLLAEAGQLVATVRLEPAKAPKAPSETNQPYYDLEAQSWRSFNPQNLIALL